MMVGVMMIVDRCGEYSVMCGDERGDMCSVVVFCVVMSVVICVVL